MNDKPYIPLSRPDIQPEDVEAVAELLRGGAIASDGPATKAAQAALSDAFGIPHVLLVTSATHAMELALMAWGIRPGDEVILPSFTFVSVATAIVRMGATPVFAEIEEPSLALDMADVERRRTPATRAIVLSHYAGIGMDPAPLLGWARRHGVKVFEDAAQCIGARYGDRWLGGLGDAACYSFHYTKNIGCGEGGAFLTADTALARKAEIIREKGTNRQKFLRGEVDKYRWVGEGSSFVLSEIHGALLGSQLQRLEAVTRRRMQLFNRYREALADLEDGRHLRLPFVPPDSQPNGHLFYVLLRDEETRDAMMDDLRARGVGATFHYVPLHSSPYATEHLGTKRGDFPVTESVCERLLRLPLYPAMTDDEAERVVGTFRDVFRQHALRP